MKEITIKLSPKSILKLFLIVLLILAIFGAGFYFGRLHYEKTELTTLENCKPAPKEKIIVQFDFETLYRIKVKKEDYFKLCSYIDTYIYSVLPKVYN